MKIDSVRQFLSLQESLRKERAQLEARLAQLNEALGSSQNRVTAPAAAFKKAAAKRGPRARNEMSLKEAVTQATKDKPLTKPEILEAIKKLGYRFVAKDPMNSLNVTLYTKGNFKNAGGKFSPAK